MVVVGHGVVVLVQFAEQPITRTRSQAMLPASVGTAQEHPEAQD